MFCRSELLLQLLIGRICIPDGGKAKSACNGRVSKGILLMCREFPGLLDDIRIWFRDYKKPDGKPENKFGFDDQWQNKEYTLKVSYAFCDTLLTRPAATLLQTTLWHAAIQHELHSLSLSYAAPFAMP